MSSHDTADRHPPKRLRAADVIEAQQATIEALTTRSSRGDVAVELTRNAKGDTQVAVKVSAPHDIDRDELVAHAQHVLDVAADIYDAACQQYPRGES